MVRETRKKNSEFLTVISHSAVTVYAGQLADINGSLHRNPNTIDLTGEYEDRSFVTTRGDSRIAITIARNIHTAKLGRLDRFLIDDELSEHKLAYALTKPLKFAGVYGGKGVYKFVLQEVNTTDDDNEELGIADYWKHFLHKPDKEGNTVLRPDTTVWPADPRTEQEEKTGRGKWM